MEPAPGPNDSIGRRALIGIESKTGVLGGMMKLAGKVSDYIRPRGGTSDPSEYVNEDGTIKIHPDTANPTYCWDKLKVKQKVETVKPISPDTPIRPDAVRFVCVSDTHNRSDTPRTMEVSVPDGDVLLHAGDFTMIGRIKEIEMFNDWLGTLPHQHKIVIAGNHDLLFDEEVKFSRHGSKLDQDRMAMKERGIAHAYNLLTNCTYIEDTEVNVAGISIYGSPWQPWFGGWGFNLERGEDCLEKWNKIPENIDILMTHGPPIGHGDLCRGGQRAGCVELLHTIQNRIRPKYHIFGHIHEDPGMTTDGSTYFINASTCDLSYRARQHPIVFDIPLPEGASKADIKSVSQSGICVIQNKQLSKSSDSRQEDEMDISQI